MKFLRLKHCFIMAALLPFYAHGQEGGYMDVGILDAYTFSVSPIFGVKYGHAEEIVYKGSKSDKRLSELLWDMKPLFYWGAEFDFSLRAPMRRWGFFVNAVLQTGLPGKTGIMEDRDWVGTEALTHFSSHDNYTDGAFFFDFSAGTSIPLVSWLRIHVFAGLSYMDLKWTAREGYTQYAQSGNIWNSSLPKNPSYGPTIAYQQNWLIFSPGIAFYADIYNRFNIGLLFKVGPVIFCDDLDDHFKRALQFSESMYGGLMLEPKMEFSFMLYDRFKFSFDLSYRFISGPRGDAKSRDVSTNTSSTVKKIGGSGYSVLDAGISATISL
jgi:outer membrane protease